MREDSEIMLGVLAGAALGYAAAVMMAPKKGSELRQDILHSVDELGECVSEYVAQGRDLIAELSSQRNSGNGFSRENPRPYRTNQ